MKYFVIIASLLISRLCEGQAFDTSVYRIQIEVSEETDKYFTKDAVWRGADGASSINLENGRVLWLFSDGFISGDQFYSRKNSKIIRNSIAIQDGYDLKKSQVRFYWSESKKKPQAFFKARGNFWFWTGHGIMLKDKLLLFLIKEHGKKTGIGFEAFGWSAVLISNPFDVPSLWRMTYIEGSETFGTIAGSAAVLKDRDYLYAYGVTEPDTHEVYLLRWKLEEAYNGILANPEWWINGKWAVRNTKLPVPEPLFIGQTEFSVHYDSILKKYFQVQSFGFGEGKIGIRMADQMQGKWTEPYMIYTPGYPGVIKPFMYAAKAHPELKANGTYITYNVNSFDFGELIKNQTIYFPKFILMKVVKKDNN